MNVNATQGIDGLRKALPELAAQGPRPGRGIRGGLHARARFRGKAESCRGLPGAGGARAGWVGRQSACLARNGMTLAEADASTGCASGHGAICNALEANIAPAGFVATALADPMTSIA